MKFALLMSVLVGTSTAFAAPAASAAPAVSVSAQRCTNPGRGIVLMLPEIAGGQLAGDLQIKHLDKVLVSIAAADVRDLTVSADGRSFSFNGNDTKGTEITKVKTVRDSVDRLVVQVWIKDRGRIGFACPPVKAN